MIEYGGDGEQFNDFSRNKYENPDNKKIFLCIIRLESNWIYNIKLEEEFN
jgi:hypothetical protein